MKVRATDAFMDLACGRERSKGEVFECSEERFGEISAKLPGWVEAVGENGPGEADGCPGGEDEDIDRLTIAQLRSLIAKRGGSAPKKARRDELVAIARRL